MEKNNQIWNIGKKLDPSILEYVSGEDLEVDKELIPYDIQVNNAHAKMLAKVGLISKQEGVKILKALDGLEKDWKAGKFELKKELEDVHMNIENYLTEKLGDIGKKINTGKSRTSQTKTCMNLYMKNNSLKLYSKLIELAKNMEKLSEKYADYKMPAYTHMQPAQPITFGYWFNAHMSLLKEDLQKLQFCIKKADVNPLGGGAVAGTSLPIDIEYTTKELGFSNKFENALASVSSRGETETEILFSLSQIMIHLSKMAQDLQLWCTKEFGMIELSDEICGGSSMLPQKKNPDVLEMVKAKTGEMISLLVENLIILKGLPSGYNMDVILTKKTVMSGFKIAFDTIGIMKIVLKNIKPNKKQMAELVKSCTFLEEVEKLVLKEQIPFRTAYMQVKETNKKI